MDVPTWLTIAIEMAHDEEPRGESGGEVASQARESEGSERTEESEGGEGDGGVHARRHEVDVDDHVAELSEG